MLNDFASVTFQVIVKYQKSSKIDFRFSFLSLQVTHLILLYLLMSKGNNTVSLNC